MKTAFIIAAALLLGLASVWYFDLSHRSVEKIDELIGKDYAYAHQLYFKTDPDRHYQVNIHHPINEFDSGILDKKHLLSDSLVHVFTWNAINHKKTIWVGKTENQSLEIIDAIRYQDDVKF